MPPRGKKRQTVKKKTSKLEAQIFVQVQNVQAHVEDDTRWTHLNISDSLFSLEASLAKLVTLQRPLESDEDPVLPKRTEEDFERFNEWLRDVHNIDLSALHLRMSRVPGAVDNFTLQATAPISAGAHIVAVPHAAMLSTTQLSTVGVTPLLRLAPELARVPSVLLALVLLAHALNPESPFGLYVHTLPRTFTTPFANFSARTFLAMRPSPAFDRAVNAMRGLVRRYTRVYIALRDLNLPAIPVAEFSFARYMWAVSVVMTRQNEIPTDPRSLALVPVWDMCNHSPGTHTTSVVLSPETRDIFVECDAMRDFKEGDPVTIFYGTRPNSELLLFSGFLQPNNVYNKMIIPLAIRRTDPLYNLKLRILEKAKVVVFPQNERLNSDWGEENVSASLKSPETDPISAFKRRILDKSYVSTVPEDTASEWILKVTAKSDGFLSDDGLALARVISMDKEMLGSFLRSGNKLPMKPLLNKAAESRALSLVIDAAKLAVERYEEQSENVTGNGSGNSGSPECSMQMRLIRQLVSEERQLLLRVIHAHQSLN